MLKQIIFLTTIDQEQMLTPGEDPRELEEQRPRGDLLTISKYITC